MPAISFKAGDRVRVKTMGRIGTVVKVELRGAGTSRTPLIMVRLDADSDERAFEEPEVELVSRA